MRVRPAAVRSSTASGTSSRSRAPTQSAFCMTHFLAVIYGTSIHTTTISSSTTTAIIIIRSQAQRRWVWFRTFGAAAHTHIYTHTQNKRRPRPGSRSHSLSTPSPRFPDSPTCCLRGYEGLLYTHTRPIPLVTAQPLLQAAWKALGTASGCPPSQPF